MATTYSVTEAQAKFPAIVREAAEQPVIITRRDKVVGYLLSPERFEAMLETMEILANPEAMKAIRDAEEGRTKYHPLSVLDAPDDEG
ncbi:MAG: type II toxin-antitoxin system Phd/YefM family antitoxin [Chthoniobacterales bacterium]